MKLPKRKKIFGKVWKIREVLQPIGNSGEDCFGLCDYECKTIYIKQKLSKDDKLRTYIHEILHAAFFELELGLSYKKDEEVVQSLEDLLIGLFKIVPR